MDFGLTGKLSEYYLGSVYQQSKAVGKREGVSFQDAHIFNFSIVTNLFGRFFCYSEPPMPLAISLGTYEIININLHFVFYNQLP